MTPSTKRAWYETIADQHATERSKNRDPKPCHCGACVTARKEGYRAKID